MRWPAGIPVAPLHAFLRPGLPTDDVPNNRVHSRNYSGALEKIKEMGGNIETELWVADLRNSPAYGIAVCKDKVRCLTKSHCEMFAYYIMTYSRFMTLGEMLSLQGIPAGRIQRPPNVSEKALAAMVGNAFSVNVMERVLSRALVAAGLLKKCKDPWGSKSLANP